MHTIITIHEAHRQVSAGVGGLTAQFGETRWTSIRSMWAEADTMVTADLCRDAVLMVCEATGTSIHHLDHPLQRIPRDTMVATSRIVFDHAVVFEQHGRGMLGLPATSIIV